MHVKQNHSLMVIGVQRREQAQNAKSSVVQQASLTYLFHLIKSQQPFFKTSDHVSYTLACYKEYVNDWLGLWSKEENCT
eukprot:m.164726 g.164726  ORF g.164726 m.164726 type:complete len:79 (-) comp16587_c0_seq1:1057-1293(-)